MTHRHAFGMGLVPIFALWTMAGERTLDELLNGLIEPVVEGLGFRLWGIERLSRGKHTALKVYIDADAGISVDDCARVSRQISSLLDVEDPIPGEYILEVSSPGMDRRLFTRAQFEEFAGVLVRISLRHSYEGRKRYTGLLAGLEGDDVILRTDEDEEFLFPLEQIERANVIPEV